MKRIYRPSLAIAALLLLANCSLVDLAYNNASSLVASEFDDAFDLNQAQSAELDLRLQQFFSWHRDEEMARYQELLERASLRLGDGITADEFMALNHEVRTAWRRLLSKAIDSVGDLAITLTPQQIERFRQYHQDAANDYDGYLDKSSQQREIYRVERSFDRIEDWYGDFDFYQEDKIRARLLSVPDIYRPWIEYREARQQALLAVLDNASTADQVQLQLKAVLLDPSTEHARSFEPVRLAYWQAYGRAVEDIDAWLTRAQKQRVVGKLQDYARVAERLKNRG